MSSIEPTPRQLGALSELPGDAPVVMINLLLFEKPDGAASYARYSEAVIEHLRRVGGEVVYAGAALQQVIGEGDAPWWDTIIAVRYPSPQAFLEMVADPGYQTIHAHRADALERAELIATAPALG